ncbi:MULTISPECIES: hypothetical protein [Methylobacterium]|uniref:hypothetical protein n=1 Tax=Methylobacterium TaxID=407 RepID=UPI0013EC1B15|nr:hypothetical protein [Methylobacterium sp. DB0501]NGM32690.1 hypothetical protein [Methylobacterium sp. DB0501]
MKIFRFENICLVSQNERRARRVEFHPRRNLIVGENHTGKSSLIKSLFIALGARPEGNLDRWDKSTIALVQFSIDGQIYFVLQQQSYRALYLSDGRCAFAAGTSSEWAGEFSKLIGFNLALTDKSQKIVDADARAFFLPFYINQDGSWQASWSTFAGLQQFKSPVAPILEYFSGVKPPLYYEINALKELAQNVLRDLQREQRLVVHVRDKFGETLPLDGPKIMPDIFEQDVQKLTEQVSLLNRRQEELRNVYVREQETLRSLRLQIDMANYELKTYDGDASFLHSEPHAILTCPTCGAEHDRTFMDILHYAEDARVLRQIIFRLQTDADKLSEEISRTRSKLHEIDINYQQISLILETRRGDLKFGDVVKGMGAEVALAAFEGELRSLKEKIDEQLSEIETYDARLHELTNRRRSAEILKIFRRAYIEARVSLNLPPIDTKRLNLRSRPNVSGSGGPRSVLAYYSALWATTFGEYGSFDVPLVIDSPQQLGQDDKNLPKMIEHVATKMPETAQIILGIEGNTKEKFEKIINLDTPYELLQADKYEEINNIVTPYLNLMYAQIFSDNESVG